VAPPRLGRTPRLLRLITAIKTDPQQSPEQLYRGLGISRAQYFQDKAAVEKALKFQYRFNRAAGTHEILNDPLIPILNLQLSEAFALILAVRQLSATGDYVLTYDAIEGVKKIVGSAQPELRGFLKEVLDEIVLQQGFGVKPEILDDLRRACAEAHHVTLSYLHYDDGALRKHTVCPLTLFFRRRALYLDSFDPTARDFRVFRVNRIRRLELTGIRGRPVGHYSFSQRFRDSFSVFTGKAATRVRVRFSRRAAPYIQESLWHWSQKITPQPGGAILYEVTVAEPREVAWWAMGWGGDAEILEPKALRDYVGQEVRRMMAMYPGRARSDGGSA
jgi:predicted DNA-binding transcriptional regulator YafY